jgi:co-chaperonin GroES (HSP10)
MTLEHLVPLRGNVLVRPDPAVTTTESGLLLPETAGLPPSMSGVVVRVSDCDYRVLRARVATVAHCLRLLDQIGLEHSCCGRVRDEMTAYMRGLANDAGEGSVKVGDRVVFPMEAGHQLVAGEDVDGSVLVLSQDALLAIVPADVTIEGVV